ncbi:MAG TPA: methylated-DNA--[protein]-cysteine S-methyltransferase [Anaeromyxobacteraceae bacterium]|nr:methylated-DNA--[protein]-cysteine S-methyltransferase [Anaeromyxobacteraceae bacterium]
MTARARFRSPVGWLTVEATDRGVVGITFGERAAAQPAVSALARGHLEAARAALADYFAGRPPQLPALDLQGSEFQRRVWRALLEIPWGEVRSYGELAASLGMPGAARAVGAANGRNPVAILVPCHRVVGAGGRLGGYSGGLDVKRKLLAHEAAHGPVLRRS